MDTLLIQTLKEIFKQFPQFWSGESLQRSLVIDAIQKKDPQIIKALIANEKVKLIYGTEIVGVLIFDFDKLVSLLKYKEYWADSFTKYRNKVGLTSEGKYLDYSSDVVLDFPFKDCVLEGGMTKEDQGKDEVYYNEVIARDEIDRLFSPKVFTNSKRYTKDGVEENINEFKDDNLIIKGNNLLALHSLKERYTGKVKLIYIDPPYNTGNDGFKYNDSFNHSSWLTFMKNRLEIARNLLKEDGFICCQINDDEQAYLKVLMDEVFGRDNYLTTLYVRVRYSDKTLKSDMNFHKEIEQIHIYRKSPLAKPILDEKEVGLDKYCYYFKELGNGTVIELGGKKVEIFNKDQYVIEIREASEFGLKEVWASGTILDGNSSGRFFRDYLTSRSQTDGLGAMYKVYGIGGDRFDYRYFTGAKRENATKGKYYQGVPLDQLNNPEAKKSTPIPSFYDLAGSFGNCRLEGGADFRSGKKPETLLAIVLKHFSEDNDLIIDYHLGSGSTCAVAHKMGRRYIGIEQMDYINEITVPRLQKVIEGDQGGISKDVNWQGGGSFVYTELMQLNYIFIHKIEQAQSTADLFQLFKLMKAEAHLNYQIELDKVLGVEYEIDGVDRFVSFNELELLEQKKLLIKVLDKNQLYVNASEMDDVNLAISESDKAFTKSFYQKD